MLKSGIKLHPVADQDTFVKGSVVVPVSRPLLTQFFKVMLNNIANHSIPDECICAFSFLVEAGGSRLKIEFHDRKRPDSVPGGGTGIPLLYECAGKGSFEFEHTMHVDQFSATVCFRDALNISPDIAR